MIKSQYTDPAFQNRGFCNHIHHVARLLGGQLEAYKIEMISNLQATSGTGAKPRCLALFRKVLGSDPAGGAWQLIKMWSEGVEYDDASAAGSVDVLPDGTVHVVMSFGKKNAAGAMTYQPWEASVARSAFAEPIAPSDIEQRLDAIETALANVGQGSLDNADREAIDRLKRLIWVG